MPKDSSSSALRVRYSNPLSPSWRCAHPLCRRRLRSLDEQLLHEQAHHSSSITLEQSLHHLELQLRDLSVDASQSSAGAHRAPRPKKRVRFQARSKSPSPDPERVLPPIILERTRDTWRAVPRGSSSSSSSLSSRSPSPHSRELQDSCEGPLVETLELKGNQWTVVAARSTHSDAPAYRTF